MNYLSLGCIGSYLAIAPLAGSQWQDGTDQAYAGCLDRVIERRQNMLIANLELYEDHSTWDDPWQVETEHYVIRTTDKPGGLIVGKGLEDMYRLYFVPVLKPGFQLPNKLAIDIPPDTTTYNQLGNQYGAEHSSMYESFFSTTHPRNAVVALYSGNTTSLLMSVTHSAVHQFLDAAYPDQPRPLWLEEGLASYYSLFWDFDYGVTQLHTYVYGGGFIPLDQLLGASIGQFATGAHRRFIELGMLFNYLLHHRPDTRTERVGDRIERSPAEDYVRGLLAGRDVRTSPLQSLLFERTAELEADFRAYDFQKD